MEKTCKFCKKSFLITRDKRLNAFYCCRKCYNLDHHTKTICKICSKEFLHHSTKKRQFCSIKCSNLARYPDRFKNCKLCDKKYLARHSKIENIYCSKDCYDKSGQRSHEKVRDKNPNFIDGKFSYRRFALRELPNHCAVCKGEKRLDAHHIDHDRENNDLSNLIILCHGCHIKYHHNLLDFD